LGSRGPRVPSPDGTPPEESLAEVRRRSPELYEAVVAGAFGGPLASSQLDRATREIATIAILAGSGGAERQLTRHVRAALGVGLAPAELLGLCEHVAVYAGFPRALNALTIVDQVLSEQQVSGSPSQQRVALADHETVVAQLGDEGPEVVLVHALGLDWRMWEPVMVALSGGRRVSAYDIRGHGSARGSPKPYSMDDAAADLIALLDAVELERAHIVGLSYGGGIAQTAAVRHPERFESLALLATTDYPFDTFEARARSGEVDGIEAQVIPSLTRWFTAGALATNGWGVRYARECVRRAYPEDWAAAWRSFTGLDVQDRLSGFEPPTLVLAGELDASTTPEIMAAIAARIPGSRYRVLPDTPHMQTLEQTGLVVDALAEFIPSGSPMG
jgi:3-oxoadipate enol-lactonase